MSSTGGRRRKPDSRSTSAGDSGTGRAAVFLAVDFFFPAWPSSTYGLTRVRFRPFVHSVAAIDTEPAARPNCASMAVWLDGISPYCHLVAVRGEIVKVSALPCTPNSSTRLAAWKAPHTYRPSSGAVPLAARCSRIRVHMYRSRSSSTRTRDPSPGASRRNRLPMRNMTWR